MLRLQAPLAERYVDAPPEELATRIAAAKEALGSRLFILGHHYQRDEVMRWADARGDSFRLSVIAKEHPEAEYIVFCGVHFMAESADVLTGPDQKVILPDLNAGCSMADMADLDSVEEAWEALAAVIDIEHLVPITYMNSSAALKAFVGRHGGAVCTSSNARAVLEWAFRPAAEGGAGGDRVLFFPDQHLGPQHRPGHGLRPRRHARVGSPPRARRAHRRRRQGGHVPAVEGPLLGAPALPARARGRLPRRAPRRHRGGAPGVLARGVRHRRSGGLDRLHHPRRRGRARRARSSASGPRSTSCSGSTTRRRTRPSSRSTR